MYVYVCMSVCLYVCMSVCVCMSMYVYVCLYMCMYVYVYVCLCKYMLTPKRLVYDFYAFGLVCQAEKCRQVCFGCGEMMHFCES